MRIIYNRGNKCKHYLAKNNSKFRQISQTIFVATDSQLELKKVETKTSRKFGSFLFRLVVVQIKGYTKECDILQKQL